MSKYIHVLNPCFFMRHMVVHVKHYKLKIKIIMFWALKKSPVQQEIGGFAIYRKRFTTTPSHVKYLHDFVRVTGITNFDDVTDYDIESYIQSIRASTSSEYRKLQAIQAVYLFMSYRKEQEKRSMPIRGRGRPAKVRRNENILALRQEGYTYDAIAIKKRLNKRTVYDIVKRLENKG